MVEPDEGWQQGWGTQDSAILGICESSLPEVLLGLGAASFMRYLSTTYRGNVLMAFVKNKI